MNESICNISFNHDASFFRIAILLKFGSIEALTAAAKSLHIPSSLIDSAEHKKDEKSSSPAPSAAAVGSNCFRDALKEDQSSITIFFDCCSTTTTTSAFPAIIITPSKQQQRRRRR
mmetsp:Transcript_29395/g.59600  ORF Transcript_29395/g.59600 Transcript_29395/m.59600 type:complete len:116 (-) Transcript_29395:3325-3672(-)